MPPKTKSKSNKTWTEEDKFNQAVTEGINAALSNQNRETALPEERKSAPHPNQDTSIVNAHANNRTAGDNQTPAPGTISNEGFHTPSSNCLSISDRQDLLESKIADNASEVKMIKEMLVSLMETLVLPKTPTKMSMPPKVLFSSPEELSTDGSEKAPSTDVDSSVFSSTDESAKKAIPQSNTTDRITSSSDRRVRDFKSILRLVPTFEGKGADTLLQYIDTFEMYLKNVKKCADYHPEEIFYQASGRLKGDAWAEWRSNGTSIHDWETLKSFLTKRFVSRQSIMDLHSSIHTTTQGNRTIQDHVSWFQQIALQLNHFGQGIGEDLQAIGVFLRGIRNTSLLASLKSTLSTHPDTTLPDILVLARELGPVFDPKKSAAMMTSARTSGPKTASKTNSSDKCSICDKLGHEASGCFTVEANRPEWYKKKLAQRAAWKKKNGNKNRNGDRNADEPLRAYSTSVLADCFTGAAQLVVDTGASHHMSNRRDWFVSFQDIDPVAITTSNGAIIYAIGKGCINFAPSGFPAIQIRNVFYIPDLSHTLFSVSALPSDVTFTVQAARCSFIRNGVIEIEGSKSDNGLFTLNGQIQFPTALTTSRSKSKSKSAADAELWHNRLGHLNYARLRYLLRMNFLDIDLDASFEQPAPCNACIKAKIARLPFPASENRATRPLEVLHSDLCGPLGPAMGFDTFDGTPLDDAYYFETIIDEYCRKVWVLPITRKSDALGKTDDFLTFMKGRFPDRPIRTFRTDGGKEYDGAKFQALFRKHGIFHDTTTPYSPQQNGVAERMNRTLVESARAMLIQENLSLRFWSDAIVTAARLHNIIPRMTVAKDQGENLRSPDQLFNDPSPHSTLGFDMVRTFGVPAYVHIPKDAQGKKNSRDPVYSKFSAKADLRLFLGYIPNVKGYRLLDPEETNKASQITTSRDVKFLEAKRQDSEELKIFFELVKLQKSSQSVQKSKKTKADANLAAFSTVAEFVKNQIREPRTIAEARKSKEWPHWKNAIDDEMKSLEENHTWHLVQKSALPRDKKCVNSRWVLKVKYNADGSIERYKARLVAQGFTQRSGIDYNETFAPVVKFNSIRLIIAIAVARNLPIHQFDIKTAFLRGDLEEQIYMKFPTGFERNDQDTGEDLICLLKKSIYGLKQSARCWYSKVDSFLLSKGYKRLESDHSVYMKPDSILAIYVDDIIVVGNDTIKTDLSREYEIQDLGKAKFILGIELDYNGSTETNQVVTLRQSKYIYEILNRFNMLDCKPVASPMDPGIDVSDDSADELTNEPYNELIGSLIYLIQCTRPDISYAVGLLSRHLKSPTRRDWERAKRVLRYLKGTIDYGVQYETKNGKDELVLYSDADYAGDKETRRSTTGYVSVFAGGPITWKSQFQKTVALSTMEAEYMALSAGVQEIIWMRRLMKELEEDNGTKPTTIYCDNQSTICFTKDPVHHQRSKHIDVRYHFARQAQEENVVAVKYIPTELMVADPLTKPCNKDKAKVLVQYLEKGQLKQEEVDGSRRDINKVKLERDC